MLLIGKIRCTQGLFFFILVYVSWMDGYLSSSSSVLINGSTSRFIKPFKCIWKAYPLSSLLFIIIIEGISKNFGEFKWRGALKGINIAGNVSITQFLFMGDVIMFGRIIIFNPRIR